MGTGYDELEIIADFLNTHDKRMRFEGDPGIELLENTRRLHAWFIKHDLISKDDEVSNDDLQMALKLRTEIRRTINNPHDQQAEFTVLNDFVKQFQFTIVFGEQGAKLQPVQTGGKRGIANLIALIFEIKRKELSYRLRVCSAEDCQWVFLDRSRPGTGKWCSMKACGNRAKNKAFRHRNKALGKPAVK
ncbi:hypothetical protein CU633_05770 [Bacillus sp. V3-13]|uniref:CGNR zinc finger domain-containing protein n=1 Tax=Bacillus sp. V3-13 TaxID=2053728 RepID=UPI000C77B89F|nr:CGNR zinc finger domain-containing protein [Bacillus sp. V3-13]PLR78317.1 hypothetical protein CU633_05770 [Bacillus sp. V3-13]